MISLFVLIATPFGSVNLSFSVPIPPNFSLSCIFSRYILQLGLIWFNIDLKLLMFVLLLFATSGLNESFTDTVDEGEIALVTEFGGDAGGDANTAELFIDRVKVKDRSVHFASHIVLVVVVSVRSRSKSSSISGKSM